MYTVKAYAAQGADSPLAPFILQRREPLPQDVRIEISYCGVCHSDLHQARNEWNATVYPCVPGHEIVGKVREVGGGVTKFKLGDTVAVGCMVDSCRICPSCADGLEQHCEHGPVFTYNSPDRHSGGMTYGGYAGSIVVDEAFVLQVPDGLDLAAAAPLLCAGITTYSPLRYWQVGPGQRVGIVGLGGLGHMALKFAHAFGAETVLFTTSPGKAGDARRLGADEVVVSRDRDAMARQAGRFDFILDTVSAQHDINAYLDLLKRDGTLTLVGVPPEGVQVMPFSLIGGRRRLAGSLIGGIRETQEMLDFCGEHGIVCDIELIPIQGINEAFERLLKSDVKYRFVIDMATLSGEPSGI
jgi:uncharacterized zinc-type alcohol dehydrogenase-like protein